MNAQALVTNIYDKWSWIPKLPQILLEEGFESATQQHYETAPETRRAWTCCELGTMEEISYNMVGAEAGREWRQKIKLAYEEANDEKVAAVLKTSPTVTLARKPLR